MRRLILGSLTLSLIAASAVMSSAGSAQAADKSPFQLLGTSQSVVRDGVGVKTAAPEVTPVGWGCHHGGYSSYRPYYGGYGSYYRPYYSGYRGYSPYYGGYGGYGSYYRGYYGSPGVYFGFGF